MPSELMDQNGVTAPSRFFGETCSVSEETIWKPKFEPEHQRQMHGSGASPHSTLGSSSTMERQPLGIGVASISNAPRKPLDHSLKQGSNMSMKPGLYGINGSKSLTNGMLHEVSLFSSSLSEVFNRKLRLSGNDVKSNQLPSTFVSRNEENCFKSLEEVEAETIGNLLPEEDDLFSGVTDELGCNALPIGKDFEDFEDFDLFSSVGGMELGDDNFYGGNRKYDFVQGVSNGKWGSNGSISGEHPSRTLFVRNIDSNINDSELKALFEQYGDIQALYTACKHRGFVMITYYDIRAARSAMGALQSKPMKHRKLDIHYSIPKDNPSENDIKQGVLIILNLDSSVSNDELHQIFGHYGDVKEIRGVPHQPHNKLIEFYDVRAAEAALHALDKSEIGKRQIKLELAPPGGARWSSMQVPDLKQDEHNIFHIPAGNLQSALKVMASSGTMMNSSNQGLYSEKLLPRSMLTENALSSHSSSFPNTFPYPVGVASSGEQFGLDSRNSFKEIEFGNQCIPNFHPHSFPEHHDIPLNTSSALGNMATGGLGVSVVDNRNNHRVSTNRHPVEFNGGVFGSPANGSCGVREHHYMLNKTNSYQHPSSPMLWQNSPSFINGFNSHCLPQMPGFPRGPPHTLGSASPFSHHIGSAPAVNPSPWEIHAYSGEPPEISSPHHGSLGSVGFAGSPQLHPLDISSRNIISQVGRNCMDMTANPVQHPSQHIIGHMFPGRNEMISMPFDSLNERTRNQFPRRNEVSSSSAKQYELDVDRILRGEDSRTTLMIKNIPNKYTSKMLLVAIDERCRGTYDFLYLPIDFKNKCNVGYAFINMIDPRQIVPFYQAFNGKKWEKFNSEKVACLAYARIQGKAALIAHFQNSSLMNEDKRCRPILFQTDGPNAGDPEPFPMGSNIRSRQTKPRMSINDENHNSAETSRREENSNRQEASVLADQVGHSETNHFI